LASEPKTQESERENPWYDYNIENNNEKLLNETIITLRLTKKHYKTVYTLAHMLGHKSLGVRTLTMFFNILGFYSAQQ